MNVIEVKDLVKIYKRGKNQSVNALDKVNLSVEEGSIFGLIGPNGAGKTTLIKTLIGVIYPTSGSFSLLNQPMSDSRVKNLVGYLPENHLFPLNFSGFDVLYYFGGLNNIPDSQLRPRIDYLLGLVGMKDWARVKIRRYSKGMMQRIGVAQALINSPKLVFLDEPTDGIDPIGKIEFRNIMQNLKKEGITVFLNSHLLSEVEQIADTIAILNKGKIIQTGPLNLLASQSAYFVIRFDGNPQALSDRSHQLLSFFKDDTYFIKTNDSIDLNFIIDDLRKNNCLIKEIVYQRPSLENIFIDSVNNGAGDARVF